MTALTITPMASIEDLARALAAEGLPVDDIEDDGRAFFAFHHAGQCIGFGGIEGDGRDRILRSVIILGAARRQGAARLHLLTTTAADFFRKLGYRDHDREDAPETVASSREFAALCPASADYLVKPL